jgi:hypothetical protein
MSGKSMPWRLALAAGMLALSATITLAASPWDKLLSTNRVDADPQKPYLLGEDNGPWMIMASTFSGDTAPQRSHDLVLELRKKYKLPAYVYERKLDLGKAEGKGVNRFGEPLKMKYNRGSELREIAVVVGNYPTVDDPAARETLRQIKHLQPETLNPKAAKQSNGDLAGWVAGYRWFAQTISGSDEKRSLGPMGHAFIVTNPLLPKEYFAPKGVDSFVLRLNEGLEFSLLNCPGKYTVRVAHFTGAAEIKQDKVKEIQEGRAQLKSRLGVAAENAHRLAAGLRKQGYEAYEFHDRNSSMVTIGHFASVGTPRADGGIDVDPTIQTLVRVFTAANAGTRNHPEAVTPKHLEGVTGVYFDVEPEAVEVPKRSLAADYRHDASVRQAMFQGRE